VTGVHAKAILQQEWEDSMETDKNNDREKIQTKK